VTQREEAQGKQRCKYCTRVTTINAAEKTDNVMRKIHYVYYRECTQNVCTNFRSEFPTPEQGKD
jgi:hypothetical protein